jgi:hypothetical protein
MLWGARTGTSQVKWLRWRWGWLILWVQNTNAHDAHVLTRGETTWSMAHVHGWHFWRLMDTESQKAVHRYWTMWTTIDEVSRSDSKVKLWCSDFVSGMEEIFLWLFSATHAQ